MRAFRKELAPSATPVDGIVKWGSPSSVPLERFPSLFKGRLSIILSYPMEHKIVMISTFKRSLRKHNTGIQIYPSSAAERSA